MGQEPEQAAKLAVDQRFAVRQAAVVRARQQRPDVVLMDLNMPKMDGIAAAR